VTLLKKRDGCKTMSSRFASGLKPPEGQPASRDIQAIANSSAYRTMPIP
jgi:hypothetical protein